MKSNEWKTKRLKDVAPLQRGFDLTKANLREGKVPVISSSGLWGYHDEAKVSGPGIVIGRYGTLGEVFFVQEDFWPHNTTLWVTEFCGNDPHFVNHLYRSIDISKHSGKTGVPGLNRNDLHSLEVAVPPLPEQKQIATILSTWDRGIDLTEKLIATNKKCKSALMQLLFMGKVRLPGFGKAHWKKCQLGDVASNSTRRNGTAKSPQVYSVTNSVGMVPMSEDVIGDSTDRYKTVSKHDFAYNPMRINVGSIAMWEGGEEVLVSPDYVVFQCGHELDAEFLNHFRTTHYWHQFVNRSGGGSVRVRIYFSDLAEMTLKLPSLDEQKAIAAVLNTQDRENELLQKKLDALRRQKKGLMQQLLTGKVRVNVTGASGE